MPGFRLYAGASLLAAALSALPTGSVWAAGAAGGTGQASTGGASTQTHGHVTITSPAGITSSSTGIALSPTLVLGMTFRPDFRRSSKSEGGLVATAPSLTGLSGCGAGFTVAGDPGQQVSLAIPDRVRMHRDKDGDEVSLPTRPDCEQPQPRPLMTATIGQGGHLSFAIGGLDALPAQQGAWRGMLHVTAQYN